jgi:hypothetical protein
LDTMSQDDAATVRCAYYLDRAADLEVGGLRE